MMGVQLVARVGLRRVALIALSACLAAALAMAVASAAHAAVPGAFATLSSSPEPLTAVTSDPATGLVYAQGFGDGNFYSYDPATDRWTQLAGAPIQANSDGGATYLDGKIYVAYPYETDLGVYDIATDTWSMVPNPLGRGTGDIAAAGGLLYLGGGTNGSTAFVSYDPASQTITPLADSPGFTGTNFCDGEGLWAWGALAPFDGKIFATQGNSCNGFAVYDIASNTWTQGPNVPDGVVMGGAVDPSSGTFYAYGDYSGSSDGSNHFYAYDIATNQWSTPPNLFPIGPTSDGGGMTYLGTPGVQGIYAAEGQNGTGFVRFSDLQDASVSEAAPSGTTAGSPAVLSATVTNKGPAAAPISFTDTAPAGLSIEGAIGGSNTSCSFSGQQVTCTVSGLQPRQSADVEIIVNPAAAGSYTNRVSVASAAGISDPDSSNDSASATLQVTAAPVATAPAQTAPAQTIPAQTTPAQTAPAQTCVVPNLRGIPVVFAKVVLSMTGCRAGKVRTVHSKSVHKGDVIKTTPRPGTYSGRRVVALRTSSGPKPRHTRKRTTHRRG